MRNKYKLSITKEVAGGKEIINYNCVSCGHRNRHIWFGREVHHCSECDKATDIKGYEV